jgi:RES domain-containing protein
VHLPRQLPADYVAFKLSLPDGSIEVLDGSALKPDWRGDIGYTRAIGDEWIRQNRSLAFAVPSAVLPESTNLLINPTHPRSGELLIEEATPFRFDPRLRPTG